MRQGKERSEARRNLSPGGSGEHGEICLDPSVLRPTSQTGLPHVSGACGITREIVGQPQRSFRIDEGRAGLRTTRSSASRSLQRPTSVEQHSRHPIAQIMKFWPELQRTLVFFHGPVERASNRIAVGEVGVLVGQLGGDRGGKSRARVARGWKLRR